MLYRVAFLLLKIRRRLIGFSAKEESPGSILLVELNSLGDAVVASHACRALKEIFPAAHIDVLTASASSQLFPRDDRTTLLEVEPGAGVSRMMSLLKGKAYDVVSSLSPAFRNLVPTYLCRSGQMVGFLDFFTGQTAFARNMRISTSASDKELWRERDESLLAGVAKVLSFVPGCPESDALYRRLLDWPTVHGAEQRKEVCLSFLSLTGLKRMPERLVSGVMTHLAEKWDDYRVFSLMTENEIEKLRRDGAVPDRLELRPVTSIEDSINVIAESAMFLGVDSAQLHLAQMTETPIVAIFGPTRSRHAITRQNNVWSFEGADACSPADIKSCAASGCRKGLPCWPESSEEICDRIDAALGGRE